MSGRSIYPLETKWQRKWTIRPKKKEKGALASQTEVVRIPVNVGSDSGTNVGRHSG